MARPTGTENTATCKTPPVKSPSVRAQRDKLPLRKRVSPSDNGYVPSALKTSTVPANRLGQLLVSARLAKGVDLQQFANESQFTVGELADLEAGHRLLNADLVEQVTSLYEVDCGPIVPGRNELVIDLDQRVMSASRRTVPLDSESRDHILDRYLSLVYLLRNGAPGTKVPLRGVDLDILSASLAERRELIEEQLLYAMEPEQESVFSLFSWFRSNLWVPAAGALVGATSIGALVLVSTPTSGEFVTTQELLNDAEFDTQTASARVQLGTATTTDSPPTTRPASVIASSAIELSADAQATVTQAEALLPFEWQQALPEWQVNYLGANDGFRGLTYPFEQTIDIFVREDDSPELIASVLAHELGHAFDVEYMTSEQREQWLQVRDIEDVTWWATAYSNDFRSGSGDFAEAFAFWAIGDPSSSQIAGEPTPEQLQIIADFFQDVEL